MLSKNLNFICYMFGNQDRRKVCYNQKYEELKIKALDVVNLTISNVLCKNVLN